MYSDLNFYMWLVIVFVWGAWAATVFWDRRVKQLRKTVDTSMLYMRAAMEQRQAHAFKEGYTLAMHKTVTEGFVPAESRMLGLMLDSGDFFPTLTDAANFVSLHAQEIEEDFPKGDFIRKLKAFYTQKH